ncbi:unnamed protein product [Clonostachys rosea f. rosea IK726]|uniref:Uncharacterized protein n=1 Tax=Clonostachys rosea f. rosea IK726 TaxID=1349383 RepID=A0ACA9UBN9_BIOOC|nr:unnamed protein product [Clonostachys rosea f. rosea IK726]
MDGILVATSASGKAGHISIGSIVHDTHGDGQVLARCSSSDEEGETALFWAARCGQAPILRRLLATNRVNPTRQYHRDQTPLYGAASRGQTLTTRLLLDTPGIEPNPINESGRTPLWIAAAQGHVSTVECLLAVPAVDISRSDDSGSSPFLAAASYGREEIQFRI